jgi:hypothetical protein
VPKIVTSCQYPPIPIRNFDWIAYADGDEESGNYGYGATEQAAIDDWNRRLRRGIRTGRSVDSTARDSCPAGSGRMTSTQPAPDINAILAAWHAGDRDTALRLADANRIAAEQRKSTRTLERNHNAQDHTRR